VLWTCAKSLYNVESRPIRDGQRAKQITALVHDVRSVAVAALHSFGRIGLVQGGRGCVTGGAGMTRDRTTNIMRPAETAIETWRLPS
jgi:hypothetical protein